MSAKITLKKLLLLASLLPITTFARMGETREQCFERYGPPSNVFPNKATQFHMNGIEITVDFDASNRVESIRYSRPKPFTDDELKDLMKVNAPEEWEIECNNFGCKGIAKKAHYISFYTGSNSLIHIETEAHELRERTAYQKAHPQDSN